MSWGEYENRVSGQQGPYVIQVDKGYGYDLKLPEYPVVIVQQAEVLEEPPKWAEALGNFLKKTGLVLGSILSLAVAIAIFPITLIGVLLIHIANKDKRYTNEFNPLFFAGTVLALPLMGALHAFREAKFIHESR